MNPRKTITKFELLDYVSANKNLFPSLIGCRTTKQERKDIFEVIFEAMSFVLSKGTSIQIMDFGVFKVTSRPATKKWLPHKNALCDVPARYKVRFLPSCKLLRKLIKTS